MIKGKVVLVPFPFDNLNTTKVRPAICLTEPIGLHKHIVLAFISNQIPNDLLDTDLVLDSNKNEFISTSLHVSSVLRLHRIMTLSSDMIQRELGEVSPSIQNEITKRLKILFKIQ